MHVEDYMNNFVAHFPRVAEALSVARDELNDIELPTGIGPLRLSLVEINNIVTHCGGFADAVHGNPSEEPSVRREVSQGVETITQEIFLSQFAETASEVASGFHVDIVNLIRLNPELMAQLSPLVRQLKVPTQSRLSVARKFETLRDMADDFLDRVSDDIPNYASRMLDEIADFSDCMSLPDGSKGPPPLADNDNNQRTV